MRLGISILLVLLLLSAALTAQEIQVPVTTFKGKILRVAEDSIILRSGHSYINVTHNESTLVEGNLAPGAQATVVYRVGDNFALKIFVR
ncbi:MAG: hypothetical protein HY319_09230 [Armatimonadetes bacterium]|nr:hypothetical protein [Armatimonadota bacterium]